MYRKTKETYFMKFVSYIRVSTQKQGRSGLGMEAQKEINAQYIASAGGVMVAEFTDVESGTHRDRPGLMEAINYCKRENATLVIAKLDRLARDVEFTFKVVNSGIKIHFCDMPQVNTMILGVFASVAQYERELCSKRTKQALAAKKAQGVKLGAPDATFTDSQRERATAAKRENAERRSTQFIDLIEMYRAQGLTLQAIADKLNAKGFTTSRGKSFNPSTIAMYLKRIN